MSESIIQKIQHRPSKMSDTGEYIATLTPFGSELYSDTREALKLARHAADNVAEIGPLAAEILREIRSERRDTAAQPPGLKGLS